MNDGFHMCAPRMRPEAEVGHLVCAHSIYRVNDCTDVIAALDVVCSFDHHEDVTCTELDLLTTVVRIWRKERAW